MSEKNDPAINFIDNPHAPDVFAGAATGFYNLGGTIIITLEAPHPDHEGGTGINRVVIGRLVMPAAGAYSLAGGLFDFLKNQGFDFSNEKPTAH